MNAKDPSFSSWEDAVIWLRTQPDQRDLVVASYYDDPLAAAADRYYQSDEWQEISKFLSGRSGRALDVGAGRGIASYALAMGGFEVISLEPDPSNLVGAGAIRSLTEETSLPIHVVEEFSEHLPFADGEFDVVFARAVLHHMHNLEQACEEIFRVLKPGGLFVAVREHVITKRDDLAIFLEAHPLHNLYGGENAFLLNEYVGALKRAGFGIRTVSEPLASPINYFPHTHDTLRKEILVRLGRIPLVKPVVNALSSSPLLFKPFLKLLSFFDNRPGRLYSFVCEKRQIIK